MDARLLKAMCAEPTRLVSWAKIERAKNSLACEPYGNVCSNKLQHCAWCDYTAPVDFTWKGYNLHVQCMQSLVNEHQFVARQVKPPANEADSFIVLRYSTHTLHHRCEVYEEMATTDNIMSRSRR